MASINELPMEKVWLLIVQTINDNPAPIQNENVRYQFELTDEESNNRQLILHNNQAALSHDLSHHADCTLRLSTADFKKLITGNLNSTTAFMFGKLKVDGSIGLALKLEKLLKEYVFDEEKIV